MQRFALEPFRLNMSISESAGTVCAEKVRMRRLWALAESSHQLAIQQLTWICDTLMKHNHQELQEFAVTARNIIKDARRAVKDAREALDSHTAEHGC
jgi:hypothetical protein